MRLLALGYTYFYRVLRLLAAVAACYLATAPLVRPDFLSTHSLERPFVGDSLTHPYWDYGQNTIVDINHAVRLVPDRQSMIGWLWSRVPLTASSWRIEFDFRIYSSSNSLVGDGFAFWYTPDQLGLGQAMGFKTSWKGLGIIFDTYDNSNYGISNTRIIGIVNNGTISYDKENDGRGQEHGHCESSLVSENLVHRARVTYIKGKSLSLDITALMRSDHRDPKNNNQKREITWVPCFTISNPQLPESGNLGFTALTGSLSANYDLYKISTNAITNGNTKAKAKANTDAKKNSADSAFSKSADSVSPSESSNSPFDFEADKIFNNRGAYYDTPYPKSAASTSWFMWFIKTALIVAVVLVVLRVAMRTMQSRRSQAMKRF